MQTPPRIYDYDPRVRYREYFARDLKLAREARLAGKSPIPFLERLKHWRGGIADWNEDFREGRAVVITDLAYPERIGDFTLKSDLKHDMERAA